MLRCGTAVDPWAVDEAAGSRIDSDNSCERCFRGRAHANARRARQKETGQTTSARQPGSAKKARKQAKSPKRCTSCLKKPAARGKGGYCVKCAKLLLPLCRKCKQPFVQQKNAPDSKKCPTCRKGRRGGSAWVVASAGSPGLGKRS